MEKFIESLPKTETHLHIEGAIPWELFEERLPGQFPMVPEFRYPEHRYDSFPQFESILIDHALRLIKKPSDYTEIAERIFQKHIEQNVRYVELSFHAGMIEFLQISGKDIIEAIRSAVPIGLEVRIFMGMSRNSYTSYLGSTLEDAVANWEGLHGIDLHGPEDLPILDWVPRLWQIARANGRTLKAHAGEFGSAENVRWAVQNLGVKRIQHGIHASKDEAVMELLAGEGVTLDICPISNYKLRIFDCWENYPLRQFLDNGIRCTISTDDPLSFANRLTDEYLTLYREMNFSVTELAQLTRAGFEVADLPEDEKAIHMKEIDCLLAVELGGVA
jgi:adenosine deaminase